MPELAASTPGPKRRAQSLLLLAVPPALAATPAASKLTLDPFQWGAGLPYPEVLLPCLCALMLWGSGLFGILRAALLHSVPARALPQGAPEKRPRLALLFAQAASLAVSARILKLLCDLCFALVLLFYLAHGEPLQWPSLLSALLLAAPALLFTSHVLPSAFAGPRGDLLLVRSLPLFQKVQIPVAALVYLLELGQQALLRVLRVNIATPHSRQIVEGLREVIEDAEIDGELGEDERRIIANVMEFHDVDVAAVMTPRTAIVSVDVEAGLEAALQLLAKSNHTRLPVHEENVDRILGTISALDLIQGLAQRPAGSEPASAELLAGQLRPLLRPAYFVPETKLISQLFAEFRAQKQKLAIVLDEYGGTAGLVTMSDVLEEIVGDMRDEFREEEPSAITVIAPGINEVKADLRIAELNEALALEIPEQADYETLGGFVLAELGHIPKKGESFVHAHSEYSVVDSSDRRVLRVRVRRLESQPAS